MLNEEKVKRIENFIFYKYGFTFDDLSCKSKKNKYVTPRHLSFYLLRKYTSFTHERVADLLNRDHSNVVTCVKKMNERMDVDLKYYKEIKEIEQEIENRLKYNSPIEALRSNVLSLKKQLKQLRLKQHEQNRQCKGIKRNREKARFNNSEKQKNKRRKFIQ